MVANVSRLPLIDRSSGNINLHARGGATIIYRRRDKTTGDYLDISADVLFFEVSGISRTALAGGSDATQRKIIIPDTLGPLLALRQGVAFALVDETVTPRKARWTGLLTAYGYSAAPPS